jgi:hypothetical protein
MSRSATPAATRPSVSAAHARSESKGGAEHTVKIAKADLVPTEANLLEEYPSFAELVDACERWCEKVNARPHRAVGAAPTTRKQRSTTN